MHFHLTILRPLFGPAKAATLTFVIREYSVLSLAALFFVGGSIALWLFSQPEPYLHDSYILADVTGIVPTGSNSGRVLVDVTLPGGPSLRLTTTSGQVIGSIIGTACVARARYIDSGSFRYRLVPMHNCQTN